MQKLSYCFRHHKSTAPHIYNIAWRRGSPGKGKSIGNGRCGVTFGSGELQMKTGGYVSRGKRTGS